MVSTYIIAVASGIALSACCGFRIFIPLLAGALAGRFGFYELASDMQWMSGWPAIAAFGTAAILEVAAYYIPVVDNLLDTIATPLAVGAGTVLASSIIPLPENEPLLRWVMALLAGGGTAGAIQLGTGLLRLFSTKATLGAGNVVVSTGENLAAIGGSVLSFLLPLLMFGIVLILLGWILFRALGRILQL
jgi:Domain of unknown function (DUF4126)